MQQKPPWPPWGQTLLVPRCSCPALPATAAASVCRRRCSGSSWPRWAPASSAPPRPPPAEPHSAPGTWTREKSSFHALKVREFRVQFTLYGNREVIILDRVSSQYFLMDIFWNCMKVVQLCLIVQLLVAPVRHLAFSFKPLVSEKCAAIRNSKNGCDKSDPLLTAASGRM